jgi:hypothetical protein
MLLFYSILVLLLGSGIAVYVYTNYAYRMYDSQYDIPRHSSFDYQNCQLDRSCWTKFSKDKSVPPMPRLRPPFMGSNKVCLKSPYISVDMPRVFFTPNYGWNAYANIA